MLIVSKRLRLWGFLGLGALFAFRTFPPSIQAQGPDDKKPAPPPSVVPFAQIKPEASFALTGERNVAVIDDAVWVTTRAAGTASKIDPKTNAIVQTVQVGKQPCGGLTGGFGSAWVGVCEKPGLARVDLKTNAVTTTISTGVGNGARLVATGIASVWLLTDAKGTLARFDPATNKAVAEMYLPAGSNALAFGQGALWSTSPSDDSLSRVNPNTNLIVETIKVGKMPRAVAVGEGAVWTVNQGDGTVSRVDPKTNKVAETIKIGPLGANAEIAAGEGSVWVSGTGTPLVRIDPRTNRVVQRFTGEGGGAIAIGHGSLWIIASPTAVVRLDPKRVEATR